MQIKEANLIIKLYIVKASALACLTFTALCFAACSSTTINVSSSPQAAKVYLRVLGKGDLKDIGETPLTLNSKQLSKLRTSSGPLMMEIQKAGYQTERILITEFSQIDLKIHEDLRPTTGLEDPMFLNQAIDHLFEAQRLAKQNRLDDALKELDEVSKVSGEIAALYELRGGVYFLQKKYPEALDDYNKLLRLNPKNPDARILQQRLQAILGQTVENGNTH